MPFDNSTESGYHPTVRMSAWAAFGRGVGRPYARRGGGTISIHALIWPNDDYCEKSGWPPDVPYCHPKLVGAGFTPDHSIRLG